MADSTKYDLVVIGSGPAGEVGAIRAAQLGLKTALIEKNEHLGGTCLNVGCIPTKALLESAKTFDKYKNASDLGFEIGEPKYSWSKIMSRKEKIVGDQRKGLLFLMNKNKVDVHWGKGALKSDRLVTVTDKTGKVTTLETKAVLLATGSMVRELPFARSNGKGILTSDSILFIDEVPESLAVIGGGVVGTEFASLFSRFGSKVSLIEMAPQILPFEDPEAVAELTKRLKKDKVKIETSCQIEGIEDTGDGVLLRIKDKGEQKFARVLVSIGRAPVTGGLGLEALKIRIDKRGFVEVDKFYHTGVGQIYAVGDIINTPALAHTASAEAIVAVEKIAGHHPPPINYAANPNAVYTYPEIASVGASEAKLKEQGVEYKVAKFPFMPMAKAKIEGATEGFVKIFIGGKYGEILGVHIVHARATEMIAEFALAINVEATIDEIGRTIHPHPTLSETLMEAAHAGMHGPIHM